MHPSATEGLCLKNETPWKCKAGSRSPSFCSEKGGETLPCLYLHPMDLHSLRVILSTFVLISVNFSRSMGILILSCTDNCISCHFATSYCLVSNIQFITKIRNYILHLKEIPLNTSSQIDCKMLITAFKPQHFKLLHPDFILQQFQLKYLSAYVDVKWSYVKRFINVMEQHFCFLLLCWASYLAKKLNLMDLIGLLLTNLYQLCVLSSLPLAVYKSITQ